MLKMTISLLAMMLVLPTFASSPMDQVMTVKERLRIQLWLEGITPYNKLQVKRELPEQIQKPLMKLSVDL